MTSARSFARLWLLFTLLTLAYAACDLALNPWLRFEGGFSMRPDLTRLPDLLHWGGRLYINGAWWLLLCNAVLLGGMGALVALALWALMDPAADEPSAKPVARATRAIAAN